MRYEREREDLLERAACDVLWSRVNIYDYDEIVRDLLPVLFPPPPPPTLRPSPAVRATTGRDDAPDGKSDSTSASPKKEQKDYQN